MTAHETVTVRMRDDVDPGQPFLRAFMLVFDGTSPYAFVPRSAPFPKVSFEQWCRDLKPRCRQPAIRIDVDLDPSGREATLPEWAAGLLIATEMWDLTA